MGHCISLMNKLQIVSSDAVVGWEKMSYHVYEDDGVVEVCAIVYTADNDECPIPHPFDVIMMVSGPTTG